jgi:hypothetical protein
MKQFGRMVIVPTSDVRRCGTIVCNDLPKLRSCGFPASFKHWHMANYLSESRVAVRLRGAMRNCRRSVKMPNIYRDKYPNHLR